MNEPRTEAGRAWLDTPAGRVVTGMRDAILAIEAEAVLGVDMDLAYTAGVEDGRAVEAIALRLVEQHASTVERLRAALGSLLALWDEYAVDPPDIERDVLAPARAALSESQP